MFKFTKAVLLILISASFLSIHAMAATPEDAAKEFERILELNMTVGVSIAANSADWVLCLNSLSSASEAEQYNHDVAVKCFIGERLRNRIQQRPDAFSSSDDRKEYFYSACSKNYQCDERDDIFGGRWTKCGHLGNYLDFLTRIKGLSANIFTAEEGMALCRDAIK